MNVSKHFQTAWYGVFLHMAMPSATCSFWPLFANSCLLRKLLSLLELEKLLASTVCGYWAGQDTFWWAEYAEIWAQDWRDGRVWGKGDNEAEPVWPKQPGEKTSKAATQFLIRVSYCNITQPACFCLLVPVFAAGLTCLLALPSSHRDREIKVTQMERSRVIPEIPGEARLANTGCAGLRTHTTVVPARLLRLQPGFTFAHRCSSRYFGKKVWGAVFLKQHAQILTRCPRFHEDYAVVRPAPPGEWGCLSRAGLIPEEENRGRSLAVPWHSSPSPWPQPLLILKVVCAAS